MGNNRSVRCQRVMSGCRIWTGRRWGTYYFLGEIKAEVYLLIPLCNYTRPVHDVLLLVLLRPFDCPFGRPFEKDSQKDTKGR